MSIKNADILKLAKAIEVIRNTVRFEQVEARAFGISLDQLGNFDTHILQESLKTVAVVSDDLMEALKEGTTS